jgi:hypothetical protein
LETHGFKQDTVLSVVLVQNNIYEVWVSTSVLDKFKQEFDVMEGFEPMVSAGVFAIAIAQDHLLKRMKLTSYKVQQLYLDYLKATWPESYKWIFENLGKRPLSPPRKQFFWLLGIGGKEIEIQFTALQV